MIPLGVLASGYVAPAGSSWTPADLTSLHAWYDASDMSTITQSGGLVSQWDDKSGNSRHATQATSTKQPTTGADTLNGLNVLTLDGGDEMLQVESSGTAAGTFVAYAVAVEDVDGGRFVTTSTNAFLMLYRKGVYAGVALLGSPETPVGYWHVYGGKFGGSSSWFRVDGTETRAGDAGTGTGWRHTYIGSRGGAFYLNGNIAEIVISSADLSSGDLASLESYLMTKWGIS